MRLGVLYNESATSERNGKETVLVVSRPPSNKDDRSAQTPHAPLSRQSLSTKSTLVLVLRLWARDGGCTNRFKQERINLLLV